jgi:ribulose 1,5-bisphosphate synthetase/thiazole synthase
VSYSALKVSRGVCQHLHVHLHTDVETDVEVVGSGSRVECEQVVGAYA